MALGGAAVLLALSGGLVRADHEPGHTIEIQTVVVTATPYRCVNGDVLGSSTACPMAVIYVGPTATPDIYNVPALAGDGKTFNYGRSWTLGDIAVASGVWLLAIVAAFYILRRMYAG